MQIVRQVEQLVREGVLSPGEQLPTVRQMAIDLRINFSTVARAYHILDERKLISTQRGRGTYIWESSLPSGQALPPGQAMTPGQAVPAGAPAEAYPAREGALTPPIRQMAQAFIMRAAAQGFTLEEMRQAFEAEAALRPKRTASS